MVQIGTLAIKNSGRDAGRECLVIDTLKDGFVMIDGNTRRRKCSLRHLELQGQVAKIKKGAEHAEVVKGLKELGVGILETKASTYEKKEKPKKTVKKGLFGTKKKEKVKKETKTKKK